ncbi:VOC family protein [Agrococcus sp. SL85]|uniref:VOC family protein n=1 Tax=Agrococcus sp. SL85 TaxID=2995141 RepID=UPI00226C8A17|nr:VOC family protein [Agrococcus sp. SL85]WAC67300.1 VOC family protein [Agrococcus sp. SL85]
MTRLTPYLSFPGTAREALTAYRDVFGGELVLHTKGEFGAEGDPQAIAHGMLQGPVELFGSDAGPGDAPLRLEGVLLSLLGTADAATLHRWFDALAEGGTDVDPLQRRPWGDSDGQVTDRFGVRWLIGYQGDPPAGEVG